MERKDGGSNKGRALAGTGTVPSRKSSGIKQKGREGSTKVATCRPRRTYNDVDGRYYGSDLIH